MALPAAQTDAALRHDLEYHRILILLASGDIESAQSTIAQSDLRKHRRASFSPCAPLMFPLLSMAGVTVLALRADHRRRLDAIQAERAERSERRSVSRPGVVPLIIHVNDEAAVNVNGETFTEPNLNKANAVRRQSRAEAMTAALAFMQQNPDASLAEIGQAAGRSKA